MNLYCNKISDIESIRKLNFKKLKFLDFSENHLPFLKVIKEIIKCEKYRNVYLYSIACQIAVCLAILLGLLLIALLFFFLLKYG